MLVSFYCSRDDDGFIYGVAKRGNNHCFRCDSVPLL